MDIAHISESCFADEILSVNSDCNEVKYLFTKPILSYMDKKSCFGWKISHFSAILFTNELDLWT